MLPFMLLVSVQMLNVTISVIGRCSNVNFYAIGEL